jgi:hypothetical protein
MRVCCVNSVPVRDYKLIISFKLSPLFFTTEITNDCDFLRVYGYMYCSKSWGSSVSIVSGYGLDDWAIQVRSPAEAKGFSSNLLVQTGSGAHPASCPMGTRGPVPGDKVQPGRDADHSAPSSAKVVDE